MKVETLLPLGKVDPGLREPGTPLADELKHLSRAQRWEEMPGYVTDEVLDTFAVVAPWDGIAEKLAARYGGLVTNAEFSIPVEHDADADRLRAA